jgi:hypothetical protein
MQLNSFYVQTQFASRKSFACPGRAPVREPAAQARVFPSPPPEPAARARRPSEGLSRLWKAVSWRISRY